MDNGIDKKKLVFLTGANGFVGKAIYKELVLNGLEVICSGKTENHNNYLNYYKIDITEPDAFSKIVKDVERTEVVIHTAGLAHQFKTPNDKTIFDKVNVDGTVNAANFALEVQAQHFVLISSVAVYGQMNILCDETMECFPKGIYAQSKYEAELKAREICERNGLSLTILRLATVYGEGDKGNISRLVKLIESGKFVWIGDGENRKSLIYNGDVAKSVLLVLDYKRSLTRIYNVSSKPISMKTIVEEIAKKLEKKILPVKIPIKILKFLIQAMKFVFRKNKSVSGFSETVEKWLSNDLFSAEKIKVELGFLAQTGLAQGIEKEIKAHLANKNLV